MHVTKGINRLARILAAGLILVMDRGKIVERGTHEQLSEERRAGYIVSCMKRSFKESGFSCRNKILGETLLVLL